MIDIKFWISRRILAMQEFFKILEDQGLRTVNMVLQGWSYTSVRTMFNVNLDTLGDPGVPPNPNES